MDISYVNIPTIFNVCKQRLKTDKNRCQQGLYKNNCTHPILVTCKKRTLHGRARIIILLMYGYWPGLTYFHLPESRLKVWRNCYAQIISCSRVFETWSPIFHIQTSHSACVMYIHSFALQYCLDICHSNHFITSADCLDFMINIGTKSILHDRCLRVRSSIIVFTIVLRFMRTLEYGNTTINGVLPHMR